MSLAGEAVARFGGLIASRLVDVTTDLSCLESAGRWAVALPFEGTPVLARFDSWRAGTANQVAGPWRGPRAWRTSMSEEAYRQAVENVRGTIAQGGVYQANICRIMSARTEDPATSDIGGLHALLAAGNPAPYQGMMRLPRQGIHIATASPELFLSRHGRTVRSRPIKGTGRTAADLLEKDAAENIMIVDLVRNDLARVSSTGSVTVPDLLLHEEHPGLVHLVSTVQGELVQDAGWPELIAATFPPGSVTGAPKLAALRVIGECEPASRSFYCGAVGWVDADAQTAELAVAIRTFWREDSTLFFGTGAGITWGSDPAAEWRETELKASRLVSVASGQWPGMLSP